MNDIENVIKEMDFQFFGSGKHKMEAEDFLAAKNNVLLDVRAREEIETIKILLSHHCQVLEIPTDEIPDRIDEIPKDKLVGVFCSAGIRATIVFTFLKSKGYENVKIILGGYPSLMQAIMPGKLYKKLKK